MVDHESPFNKLYLIPQKAWIVSYDIHKFVFFGTPPELKIMLDDMRRNISHSIQIRVIEIDNNLAGVWLSFEK